MSSKDTNRTVSFRTTRDPRFHTARKRVLERDGFICQYCNDWAATVDHILPHSFGGTDHETNLVAACRYCNSKASNLYFDSFETKREYLSQFFPQLRKRKRKKLAICADCQEVFEYRKYGATVVLCAVCNGRDLDKFTGAHLHELAAIEAMERADGGFGRGADE